MNQLRHTVRIEVYLPNQQLHGGIVDWQIRSENTSNAPTDLRIVVNGYKGYVLRKPYARLLQPPSNQIAKTHDHIRSVHP